MAAEDIDAYLAALGIQQRHTLVLLRSTILDVVPGAEQGISYAMPAFRVGATVVAGFAAFRHHLAYLPHSGSVLAALEDDLVGYTHTKSSLHFAVGHPLPAPLVRRLIETRLAASTGR